MNLSWEMIHHTEMLGFNVPADGVLTARSRGPHTSSPSRTRRRAGNELEDRDVRIDAGDGDWSCVVGDFVVWFLCGLGSVCVGGLVLVSK